MYKQKLITIIFFISILNFLKINCVPDYEIEDHKKIIFFNEILQQVEQPLKYEKWKQRGDQLQANKAFYKDFNRHMQKFQQDFEFRELLTQQEFFGALVKLQHRQAEGLFHFLYQPLDWETFVQNACWARQHVNAQMFVYAFVMAAIQRQLDHAMFLPKIYEILPRYFLNGDFVEAAEEFETGNMLILQTLSDITKANLKQAEDFKDFKVWQWWKQFEPYDQSWHAINTSNGIAASWWRPVDYTRDSLILNEHAKISYFTEDVDWNAYWHSLNLLYPSFLTADEILWQAADANERRGEFWLYCLQQLSTRYELERWALGFEALENFEWQEFVQVGYDPVLKAANGELFLRRENDAKLCNTLEVLPMLDELHAMLEGIEESIETGVYFDGKLSNLNVTMVGNMLQANKAAIADIYQSQWYRLAHMYMTQTLDRRSYEVRPHVLLNFETMLRDPLFYQFHKRIIDDYASFLLKLPPYQANELQSPILHILSAHISTLETYFDLHDLNVSNLRRTKQPKTHWTQTLYARQLRLTHRPFHLNVTIAAAKKVTAMLRIFLVTFESEEQSKKYLELNKIQIRLEPGVNNKTFSYENIFSGLHDEHHRLLNRDNLYLNALNDEQHDELWRQHDAERYCGLNTRLLLPRGLLTGLPMRLFLMLNELHDENENRHIWWRLCQPLQGKRAFGFPFDRSINVTELNGTNMYWKDVKIYHRDKN